MRPRVVSAARRCRRSALGIGPSLPSRPTAPRRPRAGTGRRASPPSSTALIRGLVEDGRRQAVAGRRTDEEFLRRAYLDLLGRIPNVQEARAFLARPGSRTSGRSWSSTCSNHPDYAKNFANQWTILLIGRKRPGADGRPRGPDRLAPQAVRRRTGPGTRSSTTWSRPRARTRRTARSTSPSPTWSSAPSR